LPLQHVRRGGDRSLECADRRLQISLRVHARQPPVAQLCKPRLSPCRQPPRERICMCFERVGGLACTLCCCFGLVRAQHNQVERHPAFRLECSHLTFELQQWLPHLGQPLADLVALVGGRGFGGAPLADDVLLL
jgi:hypothetical protein